MEERHLSLTEVAGAMGVSERTVRRWIKAGKLKAFKPGRDYRIPESAVKAFVEESAVYPKVTVPPSLQASFNGLLEEEWHTQHLGVWNDYLSRRVEWCEKVLQKQPEEDFNNPFLSLDTAIQWAIYVGIESSQLRNIVQTEVLPYANADSDLLGELRTLLDRFRAVDDQTNVRVKAMMDEEGLNEEDKEQVRLRLINGSAA